MPRRRFKFFQFQIFLTFRLFFSLGHPDIAVSLNLGCFPAGFGHGRPCGGEFRFLSRDGLFRLGHSLNSGLFSFCQRAQRSPELGNIAHIQEKYGNDFDAALDFLYKALASDMAADVPSMEKAHLEHVNNGFGELRSLQSARGLCARLLERWASVHGVKNCPLNDMALLGKIVGLRKEHFISASQIARLADEAGAKDIEHKVLFLQELLNTTRSFAPTLFDGNEGRMKVLDAVQGAVDNAIAEEDAWLASQE